jgi:pimeloyl-ACP methyl ester carboxylesterase
MTFIKVIKTVAIVAGISALIAILSGAAYERVERERTARTFTAPGRLVDIGGRRIQIDCRGHGSPTVVFESGLDIYGSLAWSSVHDSVAKTTRACAYSRAGIMWSDPSGHPFEADSTAADLHAALTKGGESAPWVMVGHSLGGPYIAIFTSRYPREVAGLVMVDITHPDQFPLYEKAAGHPIMPTPLVPQIGAALAWTGLLRLMPSAPQPASWPEAMKESPSRFLPVSIIGLASEVAAIPATLRRMGDSRALGNRPLVVLCEGTGPSEEERNMMSLTVQKGRAVNQAHITLCGDMSRWSTTGRLEVVKESSHYVQIDHPDIVVSAVKEVVGYVIAHDSTARRR